MRIVLPFFHRSGPSLGDKLDAALVLLRSMASTQATMEKKLMSISDDIAALQTAVTSENTVIGSAETLLAGLNQQLMDLAAQVDPTTAAKIQSLTQAINAKTSELAAAVAANTPATTSTTAPAGAADTTSASATQPAADGSGNAPATGS